ncbi:retropepsin-like aspartic protease [Singulisphaera rosea]
MRPTGARTVNLVGGFLAGVLTIVLCSSPSNAEGPSPEDVLCEKGFVKTGSSYRLADEDDLGARLAEIRRRYKAWAKLRENLSGSLTGLENTRHKYQQVLKSQASLEEQWQLIPKPPGSFTSPPDLNLFPPGLEPSSLPPPPPQELVNLLPPGIKLPTAEELKALLPRNRDRMPPAERRGLIVRMYTGLQETRVSLEARIVRGQFHVDDQSAELLRARGIIERRQAEIVRLVSKLRDQYTELKDDPEIRRAVESLRKPGDPRVEWTTREDYGKEAMAVGSLDADSLLKKAGDRLALKAMSRITGLSIASEDVQHELGVASGRVQSLEHEAESQVKQLADQASKEKSQVDSLAKTTDSAERTRIGAAFQAAKSRVESIQSAQVHTGSSLIEALGQFVDARSEYVRILVALRDAVEAERSGQGERTEEAAARLEILKSLPPEKARITSFERIAARLKEHEKSLKSETIPLDRNRSTLWVGATINGKAEVPMIVDLNSEEVCLSTRAAAEAGVRPEPGDPSVHVLTVDGRMISARRSHLATLQLGRSTLERVECLILPEASGDVPSRLGLRVLGAYASRVDSDATTLVLTQVHVKPILRAGRERTTKPSSSPTRSSSKSATTGRAPG